MNERIAVIARCAGVSFIAALSLISTAAAQTTARVDARLGYLVTSGDSFSDRPFISFGGALEFGQARVGGPPALGVSAGIAGGFGDVFAASMSTSWRFLVGVEAAWALSDGVDGGVPGAELVPSVQAGFQTTGGQDGRSGLTVRAGPGIRIPLAPDGRTVLTFEPVSLVLLPAPEGALEDEGRLAWELGVLKVGFRF